MLDIVPFGYHVLHACRSSSADKHCGARVAIIHSDSFNMSTVDLGRFTEFEYMSVKLWSPNAPSLIPCIYRPPSSVSNSFCDELSNMFDQLILSGQNQVVCGDYNSPGEDGELLSGRHWRCCPVIQQQLITQPTHQAGNTLDLIVVPEKSSDFVRDVTVHSLLFSDHSLIRCRLEVTWDMTEILFSYTRLQKAISELEHREITSWLRLWCFVGWFVITLVVHRHVGSDYG